VIVKRLLLIEVVATIVLTKLG